MISIEHIKPEDLPFIELRNETEDEVNEQGIVNEPVIYDTRTGKPYVNPEAA